MPANWPDLTLALALALAAAYIISSLAARLVRSLLRGILGDEHERQFIHRPGTAIQVFLFLIIGAALSFPALSLAGYTTPFAADRDAMVSWVLHSGLRIGLIALAAT